jgi:two-component system chemotaxis response regulator CheB
MACPSVVVVGASAGGLEAVSKLVGSLPADFPAAVFIVIHRGANGPAAMPVLLEKYSRLPVRVVNRPENIQSGRIYLPPLDCHLLIEDSRVRSTRGPRQHGFRPAVDPLFISAANAQGDCVAGVILSGGLDDGTAGLLAIKRLGGVTIVQNPEEALVPSMPLSALKNVEVDEVLLASEIGPRLVELIAANSRKSPAARRRPSTGRKNAMPTSNPPEVTGKHKLTPFTCPSCGGALWEVEEGTLDQYECHVGHRFGSEALKVLSDDRTENVLWAAVRALQEDAMLRRRMAAHASSRGMHLMARRWLDDAERFGANSRHVKELIEAMNGGRDDETLANEDARRSKVTRAVRRSAADRPRRQTKRARSR